MQSPSSRITARKRCERGYISDNHLNQTVNFGETWITYSLVAHIMLLILRILLWDTLLIKNSHFIVNSTINRLQIASLLTKQKRTSKKNYALNRFTLFQECS